jgi:hypothetical protein
MYDYTALAAMEQAKDILQQALSGLTKRIEEEKFRAIENEEGEIISVMDDQINKTNR